MDDKKKKVIEERVEKDSFWIKVLVITIVIVWASLVTGSWAGHYFVETQIIGKQAALSDDRSLPGEKPRNYKAVVSLDRQGKVTGSDQEKEESSDLNVPDFRNIDDPIPGIDDQAIRTLGKEQELKADEAARPPALPDKSGEVKDQKGAAKPDETASPADRQPSESPKDTPSADQATPAQSATKSAPEAARPSAQPVRETTKPAETVPESSRTKTATPEPVKTKAASPEAARTKAPSADTGRKEPAKKEEASQDKKQEAGNFDVQMGSFSNPENADKMMTDLKQKGYKAKVEKIKEGDREFYKVKMEKVDTKESAQDKAGKLKQDGFDAIIISH